MIAEISSRAALAPCLSIIHAACRMSSRRRDLGVELGDPVLHDLPVGERLASARSPVRSPGRTASRKPARRCRSSACSGGCGPGRAAPARSRSRCPRRRAGSSGHPARLVDDLGVAGPAGAGVAHHADVAHQLEAGRVGRHDDQAGPQVRRRVRVRHRHDDRERGAVGRRREPLLAVDDVVVAVDDGGGPEHHRVRAGHLRLGHREAAADLAGDERAQPPSRCSSVPCVCRISMLPASGAWVPNT